MGSATSSFAHAERLNTCDDTKGPLAPPIFHSQLDVSAYPHILDTIISYADKNTRLALRFTSHAVRDSVDDILFRHLIFLRAKKPLYAPSPYGETGPGRWSHTPSYHFVSADSLVRSDPAPDARCARRLRHTRVVDVYGAPPFGSIPARVAYVRRFNIELPPLMCARTLVDHINFPPPLVEDCYALPLGTSAHDYVQAERHVVHVEYSARGLHDCTLELPMLAPRIVFILNPAPRWKGGPGAVSPEESFFGTLVHAALSHGTVTFVGIEGVEPEVLGLKSEWSDVEDDVFYLEEEDARYEAKAVLASRVPALRRAFKRIAKQTDGASLRKCSFLTRDQYRAKVGREGYRLETERFWVTPPGKREEWTHVQASILGLV